MTLWSIRASIVETNRRLPTPAIIRPAAPQNAHFFHELPRLLPLTRAIGLPPTTVCSHSLPDARHLTGESWLEILSDRQQKVFTCYDVMGKG